MWDSTPLPASADTTTEPDGSVVDAATGFPAASSPTAPGTAANVTQVPATVTGDTITLAPPASALTGAGLTYPLYIDPTFYPDPIGAQATQWTQVDSGAQTDTSGWHESSDLQVGQCPANITPPTNSCTITGTNESIGEARSFFRMPLSADLAGATIESSELFMTDVVSVYADCKPEPTDLWTTSVIKPSTDWQHQPTKEQFVQEQDFAFGRSGCPARPNNVTWNTNDAVQDAASTMTTSSDITFGLYAKSGSDPYQWKQFLSGSKNLTMTTTYTLPPAKPDRTTSPGGACQRQQSGAVQIGYDDITFYATVYDPTDTGNLTTRFVIVDPKTGNTVYDSAQQNPPTSVTTGDGQPAQLTIPRTQLASLNPSGSGGAYTYYWYAVVTNHYQQPSPAPADFCYFTYNPNGPQAPTVSPTSFTGALGQTVQATFETPNCDPTGGTNPCPVSYTYQLGVSLPVTVSQANPCGTQPPSNSCGAQWSSGTQATGPAWTGPITLTEFGYSQLTVYGLAASGNRSEAATPTVDVTAVTTPYPDGYFTGGGGPDLLLADTGNTTGLWLYPGGYKPGTLGTPIDIGSLGTAVNGTGHDGPGDWTGAHILHGDFSGHGVQDVMAYYPSVPHAGLAQIIGGNGTSGPLQPYKQNIWSVPTGAFGPTSPQPAGVFTNTAYANPSPNATQLVAAGDASQTGTGYPDIIGILGAPGNGPYQLDLWTAQGIANYGSNPPTFLSSSGPDHADTNWAHYTLATAQPGCYPHGTCNPAATVLFALNTKTGTLWESSNPTGSTAHLVGTSGTWTQVTVPVSWGSSPPTLASADTNASGQTELWTVSGNTATSYTVTGTSPSLALTEEAANPVNPPADEWPLNDGSNLAQGTSASIATDTTNSTNAASLTGTGATWGGDTYFNYFNTYINLTQPTDPAQTSQDSYLTPSAGTVPTADADPTISVWFKTTTADGVIASLQGTPLTPGTSSGTYDPALYMGSDGHLCAQWFTGTANIAPIVSDYPVDDGLWHHAVLTTTGTGDTTTQTLSIDGTTQTIPGTNITQEVTGAIKYQPDPNGNTNLTLGAGYIGGLWPDQPNSAGSKPDYFQGQLADTTYTNGS